MKDLKKLFGFEPCLKVFPYLLVIPWMIMMYFSNSEKYEFLSRVGSVISIYIISKIYQAMFLWYWEKRPDVVAIGIKIENMYKKIYLTMKPVHWLERIIFYEKKDTLALRAEKITLGYFFSYRFQWFMRVPYLIGFYVITLSIRDVFFLGYPWGLYLFMAVTITVFMILRCVEIELMKTIDFEN